MSYLELIRDTLTFLGHTSAPAAPKQLLAATVAPPPPKPKEPPTPPPPPKVEKPAPLAFKSGQKPPSDSLADVRRAVEERLPNLKIVTEIPGDELAQKRRNRWKERTMPEVVVLGSEETIQSRTFLANLAKAISVRLAPCDLYNVSQIERQKKWDALLLGDLPRLILVTDYALHGTPALRSYLREEGSKKILGQVPLFLLSDLPRYFQDPQEKRALWAALCEQL